MMMMMMVMMMMMMMMMMKFRFNHQLPAKDRSINAIEFRLLVRDMANAVWGPYQPDSGDLRIQRSWSSQIKTKIILD